MDRPSLRYLYMYLSGEAGEHLWVLHEILEIPSRCFLHAYVMTGNCLT